MDKTQEIYEALNNLTGFHICSNTYDLAYDWLINKSDFLTKNPDNALKFRGKGTIIIKCDSETDAREMYEIIDNDYKKALDYAFEHVEEWASDEMMNTQYQMGCVGSPSPDAIDIGNGIFVNKELFAVNSGEKNE